MYHVFMASTGLMQLFNTVQGMQDQLKEVHDTAVLLAAEKEDRQRHLNVCIFFLISVTVFVAGTIE